MRIGRIRGGDFEWDVGTLVFRGGIVLSDGNR